MSDEQYEHLARIQKQFNQLSQDKYEKGAKEHGSLLHKDYTPEQLIDFAIEEAIDQVTYLLTLKEVLNK